MLSRRGTTAAAATVLAVLGSAGQAGAESGPGTGATSCAMYVCVEADAVGSDGTQDGGSKPLPNGHGTADPNEPACFFQLLVPQPPAGSTEWQGHEPGDGAVYERHCKGAGGVWPVSVGWLAEPPEAEAINPAVLAQRAVDKMALTGPDININPKPGGKGLVGMPVWMAANQGATTWGPNTASASAGGVTVTATAAVSKVVWAMGARHEGHLHRSRHGLQDVVRAQVLT
ncbi:hypothetical protein ACFYWY_36580 [Streptomyces sp. NPDC002870]|uniref:hypothetical protein n=1 Tax=Streptomyces sp. NPDC002870 TaxID=3364666 RepID=UPI0036B5EBA1